MYAVGRSLPRNSTNCLSLRTPFFWQCPLDVRIRNVVGMPIHISVMRLSRMSDDERDQTLSRLLADLADEIVSLPSVGIS